ncbi:hypothetical protein Ccrd_019857 [Cynara cardunculus var. scolymus]|uniref:Uncharacterized protein n=1 Tax=Cynara cardunculus var. scolymus TaxID=59895 RepID=A0A103Y3L3_CYNCS|nr:hypothetical protein Ccrd_019857 [Cynara cardunculus var. scolymus]
MAVRVLNFAGYLLFYSLIIRFSSSAASISKPDDLQEVIVKGLGFQSNDLKISGFDLRMVDPLFMSYIQKLMIKWTGSREEEKTKKKGLQGSPVLSPFQLAGPMELWIQDAKDMRLPLPGAKSVGLLRAVELDLPLNKTQNRFASGILTPADRLRHAYRPTSLTSPKLSPSSNKLKLKRLAPGLVELSSTLKPNSTNSISAIDLREIMAVRVPKWVKPTLDWFRGTTLRPRFWVLKPRSRVFFRLLRADVSAQTFMKIGFTVEKLSGNGSEWAGYPKWRTKPEIMRMHFEVLAKVDGEKIVPERLIQVDPVMVKDTMATNLITGHITSSSTISIIYPLKEQGGLTYKVDDSDYKVQILKHGSSFSFTCERRGRIVTPACPPTTGTLTSLGSSPKTSA